MVPPGERFAVGLTEKVLSLGSTWFRGSCLPFGIGAAGAAPGNVAGSLGAYLAASVAPRPVRVFGQRWISERAKVVQSVLLGMLSHLLQVHRNRRHVRQPSLLRCPLPPVARSAHRFVDRVLIEDVLEFVVRFASARRASVSRYASRVVTGSKGVRPPLSRISVMCVSHHAGRVLVVNVASFPHPSTAHILTASVNHASATCS